ncbi:MFS transporter [Arenicella chitinivorans]|uniref:MFS transporter n=1 Tax=Arenicella chitinivorans TaxID=1329800 RepID=A0A918VNV1_9GAMM|nr:YbfB/YjiJ family MFS transporter [Arenicella chitinivorans]GHA11294.1 MFS transporter [Arenicella chitinivorans]
MVFIKQYYRPNRYSVMFAGVCALVLTMGIARYAFTPMIPYMQDQTGMSEGLAGWLAGWSYIGYLVGLFMVWLMRDLRLKDYFFRYGLFIAVFTTAIMAFHDHRLVWYLSRFFAGISTALGFMLGTGLVLKWLLHNNQKQEMGLHFAGVGTGIVVGAIVVDFAANSLFGGLGWRGQWLALAGVGALLLVPAFLLMPFPASEQIEESARINRTEEPSKRWLTLLTIAYVCAGFSNTVNITFTSLITEYIPLENQGTLMWLFVGLAAAPAPFVWDRIARKVGYLNAIRAAFAVNIASNFLMTASVSYAAIVISSLSFGFAFMGIVSLTLTIIGNKYRYRATQVMAQLTLGYCIAQIISPIMAGVIAEQSGSFNLALFVVSGIMVLGMLCLSLMHRE